MHIIFFHIPVFRKCSSVTLTSAKSKILVLMWIKQRLHELLQLLFCIMFHIEVQNISSKLINHVVSHQQILRTIIACWYKHIERHISAATSKEIVWHDLDLTGSYLFNSQNQVGVTQIVVVNPLCSQSHNQCIRTQNTG